VLLKRMKIDAKTFRQVVEMLVKCGDVEVEVAKTDGRDAAVEVLARREKERERSP